MLKLKFVIISLIFLVFAGCTGEGTYEINNPLPTQIFDTDNETNVEVKDGSLAVIQDFESKTHDGTAFVTGTTIIIPSGESRYIYGVTDGREVHFKYRTLNIIDIANQNIDFTNILYENVSVTTNGESLNVSNLNRNSNITNTFMIYRNPTGIDITNSYRIYGMGNRVKSARQSEVRSVQDLEYIMKHNSSYLLNLTNNGIGDVEVSFRWTWHEENKEHN